MLKSKIIENTRNTFNQFTNELLFPQFCSSCEEKLKDEEVLICLTCLCDVEKVLTVNRVEDLKSSNSLDFAFSGYWFDEQMQDCLHALKYNGFSKIVAHLLNPIKSDILKIFSKYSIDCLLPVPLHKVKMRGRGFNQTEKICHYLSDISQLPIVNNIQRVNWTESQTKLTIQQRKENIQNAFKLTSEINKSNILIVDDVLTTGATANECAKVIKANSNANVGVFTICAAE